jgi:endoglucanase
VLGRYDRERADELQRAAVRAWAWAERHAGPSLQAVAGDKHGGLERDLADQRSRAAAELLFTTGEASYDRAFRECSVLPERPGDAARQRDAIFTYARLPDGRGSAELRAMARTAVTGLADAALRFAEGNAFGLTTDVAALPVIGYVGYFSVPGMISQALPRAHFLTGDPRYLSGAVRACNFSAGANPDNITFTTGVGVRPPRHPLHIDSVVSGQPAPAGITVYGQSDFAADHPFLGWAHTWFLKKCMHPDSRSWPPYESYCDIYQVPAMNEYTVHQTMARTSYHWGYLAARGPVGDARR